MSQTQIQASIADSLTVIEMGSNLRVAVWGGYGHLATQRPDRGQTPYFGDMVGITKR